MFFHLGYWSWANPRSRGAMITEGAAQFPQLAPYTWWGWVGGDILRYLWLHLFILGRQRHVRTLMGMLIRAGWAPILALPASAAVMIVCAIGLTLLIEAGPRRWLAAVIDLVFGRKRTAGSAA